MKKRFSLSGAFGKTAKTVLRIELFLILLASLALLFSYLEDRGRDPVLANALYPAMLEYIPASLTVAVSGSILISLAERDP